ncbi:MAG: hypothetical protein AB7V46_22405 [Thermomicrobiales bacterium]
MSKRSKSRIGAPTGNLREPSRIYSVRAAGRALGALVEEVLAGCPQIIAKRGKGRVLVIAEDMLMDMARQSAIPSSFSDMFPVSPTEPPLGELKVRERPGRSRPQL